jgi:hypothetical protein
MIGHQVGGVCTFNPFAKSIPHRKIVSLSGGFFAAGTISAIDPYDVPEIPVSFAKIRAIFKSVLRCENFRSGAPSGFVNLVPPGGKQPDKYAFAFSQPDHAVDKQEIGFIGP